MTDEHPVLTEKDDATQRGDNPPGAFGAATVGNGDLAPGWQPNTDTADAAAALIGRIGRERRPNKELVHPYLLVRAYTPGDRAARPTWPSIPCWESPDILLIDASYTGPFDPGRLVGSPTAGRSYRVFVRVWNLGLVPAAGLVVQAWYVDPGFFGGDPSNPAYQPQPIGAHVLDVMDDRLNPGAMQLVELDTPWKIPAGLTGHECLLAAASCPLDQWHGVLDANNDRHVGQRNLTILEGAADAKALLFGLGTMVTKTAVLELIHGGAAVGPVLKGVLGTTQTEYGDPSKLSAPSTLRRGVGMGDAGTHLLTMFQTGGGWLVADSARTWTMAVELGMVRGGAHGRDAAGGQDAAGRRPAKAPHPFATPLATRRLLEKMGPERWRHVGLVIDAEPGEALIEGLAKLWDVPGMGASDLAHALAEGGPFAHLLRLVHTDPETGESGGYSLALLG